MDERDTGEQRSEATDVPRTPLSFLFAAVIFLFTHFYNYGVAVERTQGAALVKECLFQQIDNLAGGAAILFIVALYALGSSRIVRKDALHGLIYGVTAIGGLYLLYATYRVWPPDCYNEVPYLIEYFIPA